MEEASLQCYSLICDLPTFRWRIAYSSKQYDKRVHSLSGLSFALGCDCSSCDCLCSITEVILVEKEIEGRDTLKSRPADVG